MTEFKDALKIFDNGSDTDRLESGWNSYSFLPDDIEIIRRALLIADRLIRDPTYAMVYHGAVAIMN